MSWRPWHVAWQEALYGAGGFYRRPEGPAAHFATSAQGIPHADTVMAQAISQLTKHHSVHHLIDLGCGRGELLAAVARLRPDLELTGVDVVERPPGLPPAINWIRSPGGARLPEQLCALDDVLVLAHEWLDVVPCTIAARDRHDQLRIVEVDDDATQRLGEPLAGPDLAWQQQHWPHAESLDVGLSRDLAWADLVSRVRGGVVAAVDYGHLAAHRPAQSTLSGFRSGAVVPPSVDGSTDVTAHVAMDTLQDAHLRTQRDILAYAEPPAAAYDLARQAPADYVRALARRSAWTALRARGGLGDFWWATSVVTAATAAPS